MKKIKVIIKREKREGKEQESSGLVSKEQVRLNEARCNKTYVAVLSHNKTVYLHDTISCYTTHSIVEYDVVLKNIM